MIFARKITPALTSLVKKIDEATAKNQGCSMGSFVVFCSDDEELEGKLKQLAKKEGLKHTVLTVDNPTGPRGYDIPKEADVTVILYKQKQVKANHAFRKGEFKADDVQKILKDLPKIVK